MMTSRLLSILVTLTLLLGSGCLQSEPKKTLEPLQKLYLATAGVAEVHANFCLIDPAASKQKLKILFVIDKSSSNQNPPESTDPNGFKRYSSLMDLLGTANTDGSNQQNTYFGLVNFSSGATTVQNFTNDLPHFRDLARREWNGSGSPANPRPNDFGETDYLGALQAARAEIERDLIETLNSYQEADVTSRYLVVMVSDGYPTVNGVAQNPATIENAILPQYSSSLLSLKNDTRYKKYLDDIVLHAGYYHSGPNLDPNARDLLENMSIWGGGDFHIFGAGSAIDYALFAVPNRHVRYVLSDVFVENLNTVWGVDGTLKLDTDHDGLSDELEAALGSNRELRDSDGNGVSDYVEYRTKGVPCKDPACSREELKRDNYVGCQGMIKSNTGGTITFGDADGDSLNDCEEWILRSDRDNFDSNLDRVPDGIAFRNRLKFIAGGSDAHADPDNDGMTNAQEIKRFTPLNKPNASVLNLKPADYFLRHVDTTSGSSCYELRVKDLPTLGWDNLIRISLVQNLATVENKAVLRSATIRLNGKSPRIEVHHSDFK